MARIQQMLWKVNYSDIVFVNMVYVTLLLADAEMDMGWLSLGRDGSNFMTTVVDWVGLGLITL